jgi:hypothetical protein
MRPFVKFKSSALVKLEKAANSMTTQEADVFDAWVGRQRLEGLESDKGKENATNILSWLRERNLEIINRNLDLAVQNIICNGHLHAPLVWKRIGGQETRTGDVRRRPGNLAQPSRIRTCRDTVRPGSARQDG